MPLGNSLTKGSYCLNGDIAQCISQTHDSMIIGYRYQLYSMMKLSGFNFDFVGNELHGCSKSDFTDCNHAGYSGIWSTSLANKLSENNKYLLTINQPDIILLEIGTNDIYGGSTSTAGVNNILNIIDDYETSSGKDVLVLLSRVIKFTAGTFRAELVSTFNNNLWSLYTTRKNNGDLIEWLDIGQNIDNRLITNGGDMMDQLHPGQDGYDKMAVQWYSVINSLNQRPVASPVPQQFTGQGENFSLINLTIPDVSRIFFYSYILLRYLPSVMVNLLLRHLFCIHLKVS